MQKTRLKKGLSLFKTVGLIGAGVLLLSQAGVMAELSYPRFMEKEAVNDSSFLLRNHERQNSINQGADPATFPVASLALCKTGHQATNSQNLSDLTHLRLSKTHNGRSCPWQGNMWMMPRYLGRLWAKTGSFPGLLLALSKAEAPQANQGTPAVAWEGGNIIGNYPGWSKRRQDSSHLPMTNESYCFPVAYPFSFRNSWNDWRSGGRLHRAVDIFAREGTGVYAVTDGVIQTLTTYGGGGGITLLLRGHDSRGYGYMHLQGYAPGIVEGKTVKAGELIAYVGRTGIQNSNPHLHLQVYADSRMCRDELLNPYGLLVQLCHGLGVSDLNGSKIARGYDNPRIPAKRSQLAQRLDANRLIRNNSKIIVKEPVITIIKNF